MRHIIFVLIFILSTLNGSWSTANAKTVNSQLSTLNSQLTSWLSTYTRWDARINTPTLKSCDIDERRKTITVTLGGGFQEQHFTSVVVDSVYSRVRSLLPSEYSRYTLSIVAEDHPIEQLVPNFLRTRNIDQSRLWKKSYNGAPWVRNISRPYTADDGLEGTHLSLWQSHGKYWKSATEAWTWQRPRLFCTCEDLFSQTFVIPYIIPMLQNAGAVVFTPRERDWQNHEVIIDNDTPQQSGRYSEIAPSKKSKQRWQDVPLGFANTKPYYTPVDSPFCAGTARSIPSVGNAQDASFAEWTPDIPEAGRYAVYVSYKTLPGSIPDARYTVYHRGGSTEFLVNQQMGGGTWVYLGTF